MWNYAKKYLYFAIPAALFMVGEVSMDLLQPGLMRQIVDDGVLKLDASGAGGLELIVRLGLIMILLVLFGGACGALNNMFVHLTSQNIGNEIRKDCFRRIMTFSFPQMDRFGTGSLVTRVTNDITQVQNLAAQFVRGMIRTTMLMGGSIFCMFRLNRQFGWMLLCAFPLLAGCMGLCLYKAGPQLLRLQEQLDRINSILQEDVSGIRVIKACVREGYEKLRFGKANDALVGTQLHVLMIFAFMNPVMNALMYIVVALAGDFHLLHRAERLLHLHVQLLCRLGFDNLGIETHHGKHQCPLTESNAVFTIYVGRHQGTLVSLVIHMCTGKGFARLVGNGALNVLCCHLQRGQYSHQQ